MISLSKILAKTNNKCGLCGQKIIRAHAQYGEVRLTTWQTLGGSYTLDESSEEPIAKFNSNPEIRAHHLHYEVCGNQDDQRGEYL